LVHAGDIQLSGLRG